MEVRVVMKELREQLNSYILRVVNRLIGGILCVV